jgi:hypothetical protein
VSGEAAQLVTHVAEGLEALLVRRAGARRIGEAPVDAARAAQERRADSSAHSVTTTSTSAASSASTPFERWPRRSTPISSSARIASGFTCDGCDPADEILTSPGARERAIPSAIWLRAEFATQRKSRCRG